MELLINPETEKPYRAFDYLDMVSVAVLEKKKQYHKKGNNYNKV